MHAQIEINYLLKTNVTRFICFFHMYNSFSVCAYFFSIFISNVYFVYYGVDDSTNIDVV